MASAAAYQVRSAAPTQDVYMIGCAPFGVAESAHWNPFGANGATSDEEADATVAAAGVALGLRLSRRRGPLLVDIDRPLGRLRAARPGARAGGPPPRDLTALQSTIYESKII